VNALHEGDDDDDDDDGDDDDDDKSFTFESNTHCDSFKENL
jgi:hypothetical protein